MADVVTLGLRVLAQTAEARRDLSATASHVERTASQVTRANQSIAQSNAQLLRSFNLSGAVNQLSSSLSERGSTIGAFFSRLTGNVREFAAGLRDGSREAVREFGGTEAVIRRLTGGYRDLDVEQKNVGKGALTLAQSFRALGVLGLGALLKSVAEGALESAVELDKNRQTLAALTGGVDNANAKIAELRKLAAETPGLTASVATSVFAQIKASGEVADATINRTAQSIGKLNAIFDLKGANEFARNLTQIFKQGFEQGDIKEAIGRVPIFEQLLQNAFGTTNGENLRKLKESGKLTLEGFLTGINEAIGKDPRFANIRESIGSQLEKAKDNFVFALAPLGEEIAANLFPIFNRLQPVVERVIGELTTQLRDSREEFGEVTDAADNLFGAIQNIAQSSGITFSLQNEMRDLAAIINFITGGVVFLQDVVELAGASALFAIKGVVLALEGALASALDLVGIKVDALEADMVRLRDEVTELNGRLEQGLKNTDAFYARQRQQEADRKRAPAFFDAGNAVPYDPKTGKPLNPRDVAPKTSPAGGGRGGRGAGGGRANTLERETQLKLQLLREQEKAAQRAAEIEIEAARRAYSERRLSAEQLERVIVEAEKRMLAAKQVGFAAERKALEQSKLKGDERAVKLAELANREAEAQQRTSDAIIKAQTETQRVRDRVFEQSERTRAELEQSAATAAIERIRQAAADRVVTEENAAREITAIEEAQFEQRRLRLVAQGVLANQDLAELSRINGELVKLEQERQLATEAAQLRIGEAQRKDLANLRAFLEERNKLLEAVRRDDIEALNRRATDLEARAQNQPDLRFDAIEARRQAAEASLQLENTLNLQRIEAERQDALRTAQTAQQKEEIERLSNDRRLAEDQRFNAERSAIRQQAAQQEAALDPSSNLSIFGVGDESLSKLEAFGQTAATVFGQVSASAGNMRSILSGAMSQVSSGLQTMIQNFILTGQTGPAALKKLAAGALASLASQSIVKAIFETAEGFAALARYDGASAALHFKAAAIYGVVGAVAGGVAAALSGGGAAAGSGGGAGSSSGGAFDAPQKDLRVSRGNPFGQTVGEAAQERVDQGEFGPFGVFKRLADATEKFAAKVNAVSPGDVFVAGAAERPDAVSTAVVQQTRDDAGFVRNFGLNIGLT